MTRRKLQAAIFRNRHRRSEPKVPNILGGPPPVLKVYILSLGWVSYPFFWEEVTEKYG